MPSRFLRGLLSLELEERILNAGAIVAAVSVFLPWISGEWLGVENDSYTGFGFYTAFLGAVIFLINLGLLLLTLIPLVGGPVLVKKRYREFVRLLLSSQAVVLVLAALSVLTKVTFEFSRMEVRFGIYFCLVGNLVVLFEAVLRFIEQRRSAGQEQFHHPEDHGSRVVTKETLMPAPPPPPPPPPPAPEEHPLYPRQ
jgi:hypothetical protein